MAWETRDGKGRYYTRSKMVGGRVTREYYGAGPKGEQAAAEDARRRAEWQAQTDALRAEKARWETVEQSSNELEELTTLLMRVELYAAGYHRHAKGQWRKWHD